MDLDIFNSSDWKKKLESETSGLSTENFGILVCADKSIGKKYSDDCYKNNKFKYFILDLTANIIDKSAKGNIDKIITILKAIKAAKDFKYLLLCGSYDEIPGLNGKGNWVGLDNDIKNLDYPYIILENVHLSTFNMKKYKSAFENGLRVGRWKTDTCGEYKLPNKKCTAFYAKKALHINTSAIAKSCTKAIVSPLKEAEVLEFPDFTNYKKVDGIIRDYSISSSEKFKLLSPANGKGILQFNTHGCNQVYFSTTEDCYGVYLSEISQAVGSEYVMFTNACNTTQEIYNVNGYSYKFCKGILGPAGTGYMINGNTYWAKLQKASITEFNKGKSMGDALITGMLTTFNVVIPMYSLYVLITAKLIGDPAFKA